LVFSMGVGPSSGASLAPVACGIFRLRHLLPPSLNCANLGGTFFGMFGPALCTFPIGRSSLISCLGCEGHVAPKCPRRLSSPELPLCDFLLVDISSRGFQEDSRHSTLTVFLSSPRDVSSVAFPLIFTKMSPFPVSSAPTGHLYPRFMRFFFFFFLSFFFDHPHLHPPRSRSFEAAFFWPAPLFFPPPPDFDPEKPWSPLGQTEGILPF